MIERQWTENSPLVISDPLLRAANSAEASGAGADLVDDVDTGGGGGIFPGGGGGGTPAGAAGAAGAADLSDFASPPCKREGNTQMQ